MGETVKQLDWVSRGERHPPAENLYAAETPFCIYMIAERKDGSGCTSYTVSGVGFRSKCSTLEEAKAASQADFAKRVQDCLAKAEATP